MMPHCGYDAGRPKMIRLTSAERNALLRKTGALSGAEHQLSYKKGFFRQSDATNLHANRKAIFDLNSIVEVANSGRSATRAKDDLRALFNMPDPIVPRQLGATKWI